MATTSDLTVTFGGGKRVVAELGGRTIPTDQPVDEGGEGSAPTPFELFLASIGTCAGTYVASFCRKRGLATDGVRLVQRIALDEKTGVLSGVELDIEVPASFPEKYREALVRAANGCAVKKAVQAQPPFTVRIVAG